MPPMSKKAALGTLIVLGPITTIWALDQFIIIPAYNKYMKEREQSQ